MKAVVNFLLGYVYLGVSGAFPERFLNLCAQNAVAFWDLQWADEHTLTLRVSRRDVKTAHALGQKVMCDVTTRRRAGVPYFLAQFRQRYALWLGLVLAVAAVFVFSRFILTIDCSGNENVTTAEILSELNRCGVRLGSYGPGIDEKEVSNQVLLRIPELSWMAINLHGTRAEVIVREKLPKPQGADLTRPSDVFSTATGIITHMEVLDGKPLFKEGDTVLEGEVLISGTMDIREPAWSETDLGVRVVHAMGNVYARTWRTLQAQIPLETMVKSYTGQRDTRFSIQVLGKRLNFYGNAFISMDKYDKITNTHGLTLPGGQTMPLALTRETYRGYDTVPAPLDASAAEALLRERLEARLKQLVGDGEITSMEFTAAEQTGGLTVTLNAECSEQIARVVTYEGQLGVNPPGAAGSIN